MVAKVHLLQGTETDTQTVMSCKGCKLERPIDRLVWLHGLERFQSTEKDRQTGMVSKVAKVAKYRGIWKDRYGCKGCEVQRQINRKICLQKLERLRGTDI